MRALENKLEQSERKALDRDAKLVAALEEQRDLRTRLSKATTKIADLKGQVLLLSAKKVFDRENVFPNGLRNIRTSDPISKVKLIYPASKENKWWLSVELSDSIFSQATYYRSDDAENPLVSHVLYHFDRDHRTTLLRQLSDTFGPPTAVEETYEGSKELVWRYADTYELQLSNSTYHVIETCATAIRRNSATGSRVSATERKECSEEMAASRASPL